MRGDYYMGTPKTVELISRTGNRGREETVVKPTQMGRFLLFEMGLCSPQ